MDIPVALRAPLAVMFVAFSIMLGAVSFGITNNANELKASIYDACVARSVLEANSNKILDQLIENAMVSKVFSPAEQADRIAGWRAVRHDSEACVRL